MNEPIIIGILQTDFPNLQAIYLFGSWGTADEWPNSDIDIGLLLPPIDAKNIDFHKLMQSQLSLEAALGKKVDLLNLREVSTVLQKEVIMADRRIYIANEYAAEEFEMLTISFYVKLNEERAEILAEGLRTGRFYNI